MQNISKLKKRVNSSSSELIINEEIEPLNSTMFKQLLIAYGWSDFPYHTICYQLFVLLKQHNEENDFKKLYSVSVWLGCLNEEIYHTTQYTLSLSHLVKNSGMTPIDFFDYCLKFLSLLENWDEVTRIVNECKQIHQKLIIYRSCCNNYEQWSMKLMNSIDKYISETADTSCRKIQLNLLKDDFGHPANAPGYLSLSFKQKLNEFYSHSMLYCSVDIVEECTTVLERRCHSVVAAFPTSQSKEVTPMKRKRSLSFVSLTPLVNTLTKSSSKEEFINWLDNQYIIFQKMDVLSPQTNKSPSAISLKEKLFIVISILLEQISTKTDAPLTNAISSERFRNILLLIVEYFERYLMDILNSQTPLFEMEISHIGEVFDAYFVLVLDVLMKNLPQLEIFKDLAMYLENYSITKNILLDTIKREQDNFKSIVDESIDMISSLKPLSSFSFTKISLFSCLKVLKCILRKIQVFSIHLSLSKDMIGSSWDICVFILTNQMLCQKLVVKSGGEFDVILVCVLYGVCKAYDQDRQFKELLVILKKYFFKNGNIFLNVQYSINDKECIIMDILKFYNEIFLAEMNEIFQSIHLQVKNNKNSSLIQHDHNALQNLNIISPIPHIPLPLNRIISTDIDCKNDDITCIGKHYQITENLSVAVSPKKSLSSSSVPSNQSVKGFHYLFGELLSSPSIPPTKFPQTATIATLLKTTINTNPSKAKCSRKLLFDTSAIISESSSNND